MWNDTDNQVYSETRVCHKCWDTFSNCDCETLRLRQELADARKEIKELRKLLKDKVVKEAQ